MSRGLHLSFNGVTGYIVPDRKCLPCPAAPNLCLKRVPFACQVSCNNHRRNPDFSGQPKRSFRSKTRQFQERDGSENLEETDVRPSKNGSHLSPSSNQSTDQRYLATALPGQREKGIVELFRNVQAQLRIRAAVKEEKKMEAAQQGQGERGTVDSLLKLLRTRSIDQERKDESNPDQPARSNPLEEEYNSNFIASVSINSEEVHQPDTSTHSRPVSKFRRKSPVPSVKFQPVFSVEEDGSTTSSSQVVCVIDEQDPEPEPFVGPDVTFSDDPSITSDTDETYEEIKESTITEMGSLGSLKITELRGIAKSRGVKRYSKLKKGELVELLASL